MQQRRLGKHEISAIGLGAMPMSVRERNDDERSVATIRRAVELGLDPAPGFATATKAFEAIDAGARYVKLFPAGTYGSGHVRALKAVLPPHVQVWAVGGVKPDDFLEWWAAGCRGFGLGSELYKAGQSPEETFEKAKVAVAAAAALPR